MSAGADRDSQKSGQEKVDTGGRETDHQAQWYQSGGNAVKMSLFTSSPTPSCIAEQRWPHEKSPLVTIFCATYNHRRFIAQAIDGFLMQETRFPVEIVVHDDASTDGTADIVRNYVQRYEHLFRPVFQQENQLSKGRRLLPTLCDFVRGNYIAMCDGDDYWTDPRKLQQQIDFLTANPDYVASTHPRRVVDAKGNHVEDTFFPIPYKTDSSESELSKCQHILPSLTLMMRNVTSSYPAEARNVHNGDLFLWSYLGQFGKCKFLPEIKPAVYRRHAGGVWSTLLNTEMRLEEINTFFWLYRYHKRVGNAAYAQHFMDRIAERASQLASTDALTSVLCQRKSAQRKKKYAILNGKIRRARYRLRSLLNTVIDSARQ